MRLFPALLSVAVTVSPLFAENIVLNPGFETGNAKGNSPAAEWKYWERENGKGKAERVEEANGNHALHITYTGKKDFNVANSHEVDVKPGQVWRVSCRIQCKDPDTESPSVRAGWVQVSGFNGDKVVDWRLASTPAANGEGWRMYETYCEIPDGVNRIRIRINGSEKTDFLIDDVSAEISAWRDMPKGTPVHGWASKRVEEPMGRGLAALETPYGVHVSWRLLASDAPGTAFDVFRGATQLNKEPIRQTTDFLDTNAVDRSAVYRLSRAGESATAPVTPLANPRVAPFLRIPLSDPKATVQKVGICDLNGDGVYDYVAKTPSDNIDPASSYWKKSPDTYRLEAHLGDGTFLWKKDLGWNIERGVWYSPFIVCDLDGDGKAEVIAKVGPEKDCRDKDGRVQRGDEWFAILDGMTGRELARAPWPPRDALENYNLASRNQMAVAYLDGKTPCLLTLRGTYGRMLAHAWTFHNGKLESLWSFDNKGLPKKYQGQGAHSCLCVDVDGDGRDEVLLGSLALDDDGSILWCTGRGHNDSHYFGDIDPARPGMELSYNYETAQPKGGGIQLVNPADGKPIWLLPDPTKHVHSSGMCTDIDPLSPGLEIYGSDSIDHTMTADRWLLSASGRPLLTGTNVNFKFGVPSAYWDADLQRELVRGNMKKYGGTGSFSERIEGNIIVIADVIGDWREEVLTSVPGELRIYSTPLPAFDRRTCLMQDASYRSRNCMNTMGYTQVPILTYVPSALSPNVNLMFTEEGKTKRCRIIVSAPMNEKLEGEMELILPDGVAAEPFEKRVSLAPGECAVREFSLRHTGKAERGDLFRAALHLSGERTLVTAEPWGL
jgi:rhamnogalacturonan endolyase